MTNFHFSSKFKYANILSLILFALSVILIFFKGLNYGIDFKGGILLELRSIHLSLIEANEKINAGNKKLELASRGYNIANDLFLTGMTTQLELLGSEVSLNRAELNLLQAKYEFQIALAKLSRAIGNNTTGNTK